MDLATLMRTITEQGPTYWGAAAAVALGATLLITAAVLQWRRFRTSGPRRRQRPAAGPLAHPSAFAEYASHAVRPPSAAPRTVEPALAGRLAAAADRLAAIRADMTRWEHLPDGSDLKATSSHVEYVFRSGEA